jgi:2-polyprenyl-3-methyl-5-hydroxy-6-metoxy-1,4-benzoquinol methylase
MNLPEKLTQITPAKVVGKVRFVAKQAVTKRKGTPSRGKTAEISVVKALADERRFRDHALASLAWTEPPPYDLECLKTSINAQGMVFMADLWPFIADYLRTLKWGTKIRILDVGAGPAAGTDWLAKVLSGTFFGVNAEVTAMELMPIYENYATLFFQNTRYLCGLVLADLPAGDNYDILIASHVIEHVDDPTEFVREMQSRCTGMVFIFAPFDEQPPLSEGHVNTFTKSSLEALGATKIDLIHSMGWRVGKKDEAFCFVAQFPGLA